MDDIKFMEMVQAGNFEEYSRNQLAMFVVRYRPTMTAQAAADLIGVALHDVTCARMIQQRGIQALWEAVESDQLSLEGAYAIVRTFGRESQGEELAKRLDPAVRRDALGRTSKDQRGSIKQFPKRPLDERVTKSLDQLENAIDMLEEFVGENGSRDHADLYLGWMKRAFPGQD